MNTLVVGDSCLDIFKYGTSKRFSPEAPVPVFTPEKETSNPGMAANVANNISSFGVDCDLITNKNEIRKIRFVDLKSKQMIIRIDENDTLPLDDNFDNLEEFQLDKYNALVISDYNKGFLSTENIGFLLSAKIPTFLQTSKKLDDWCLDSNFIKINESEYNNSREFIEANKKTLATKLIVTLGEKGCMFNNENYIIKNKKDIRDLSGAGDTFLAGFVYKYVSTKNEILSIEYAQEMASAVVELSGVNVAGKSKKSFTKLAL
jgi:bifunctional ADP-heptose synthase (sugar kinase/adenylyltransferase)|tara:strand:+ start:25 stop:807 length:783 start_codon:yes stop_codon:yes gene_type:complete